MLDAGCQHQQVSDAERIFPTERLEDNLPLEKMNAHRAVGVVCWEITAWR